MLPKRRDGCESRVNPRPVPGWHRRGVRSAVIVTALFFVLTAPAAAEPVRWYWPVAKVMRVIDGTRVRVGTRAVRIRSETTLCSGIGPSIRRAGVRRWSRFTCTFTTFTRRGLDRDLEFTVRVAGRQAAIITDAHWIRGSR